MFNSWPCSVGYGSGVAVAGSCSSDLTPSLGTSIYGRYGPKKTEGKKKKKDREKEKKTSLAISEAQTAGSSGKEHPVQWPSSLTAPTPANYTIIMVGVG